VVEPEPLGRQLALTAKLVRAHFEAALADGGGSLAVWVVLLSAIQESGLSQRELAGRLQIEGPTLTRHLDRMEADGLIRRRRDANDRRVIRVEATDAGRRLHRRLRQRAQRVDAELFAGFSERDRATLSRLLGRITTNVEEHHGHAATG
jgi:MarR family transcriptional regulator for hemolysin